MKRIAKFMAVIMILSLCLSSLTALAAGTVTTTGSVNIRSGASRDYVSLGTVPSGVTLSYSATSTDSRGVKWYKITYASVTGWISSKYAKEGSGGGGGGGSSSPIGTVTTTGSMHIRAGADRSYASRGTVPSGVTLSYYATSKDGRGVTWYKVTYKGVTGWISSTYTKGAGGSGSYTGGTAASGTITTTANVNQRKGAGTIYDQVGMVPKGVTLTYDRTGKDGNGTTWYRVTYGGRTGWIISSYTKPYTPTAVGKVITTGTVHHRASANRTSTSQGVIGIGVTLTYDKTSVDSRGVTWYHVTFNGKPGWISSKYAKKL